MNYNLDILLTGIMLVTVIIGILTNSSKKFKILLIALALATSLGSLINSISAKKDDQITKKIVESLVTSKNPPEEFSHVLQKQL